MTLSCSRSAVTPPLLRVRAEAERLAARSREAEARCSGRERILWGHAAANAEAVTEAEREADARWLWAAACDDARSAGEFGKQS